MVKSVEARISIKFFYSLNTISQHFIFSTKKDAKICFDKRFILHDRFENKIKEENLHDKYNLEFEERIDNEDRVIIKFIRPEKSLNLKNFFVVISGFLPDNTGCEYCIYKKQRKNNIYCPELKKTLIEPLKRCKAFKQKGGLFKT